MCTPVQHRTEGALGQIGPPLVGSYDYRLVALSIGIAISASYAALDLGGRVTGARGWVRAAWLAGGAMAMGLGMWSMHFTGMLAFNLPVRVTYHWPTVLVSLLVAMLAGAVALYIVSGRKMSRLKVLLPGSILIGLGIAGVHYIGMAAMRLSAVCHYSPLPVIASILIAVIASLIALTFTFDYREDFRGASIAKVGSAAVMGTAIAAMHYTGMAAAIFIPSHVAPDQSHAASLSALGLGGIAIGTFMVQGAAILTSALDRRMASQAQELQTSERFRQIANILRDVLLLTTADLSEVLFVNRAYEVIWGRTIESLYADARSWVEGVHPEDRQQVQEALQRLVDGAPLDNLECRVVRMDGSVAWVRLRAYPVRDARGHFYRIVGTAHEFTKRKLAEEALRASEREQRRIAEQLTRERARLVEAQEVANVGSWEVELQSLNVTWSTQTHRIFETDPSRFKPTRSEFREFIHPEDRAKVDAAFVASLDNLSPCTVEYRILMPDARVKFLEERWKAFHDEQGKRVRLAGTCRDITERVRAEEALRELSGRLVRLQDEERRRIARDLHDDLGQALFVIKLDLGRLTAHISDEPAQKLVADIVNKLRVCMDKTRTVAQLLHPPELAALGLREAIVVFAEGFGERSGIAVEIDLPEKLPRLTLSAETVLFRVIQECLLNIQRHSGSPKARIQMEIDSKQLTLEVRDEGVGIQVATSGRAEAAGPRLGVGLAGMSERMKEIGGRLEITSAAWGTSVKAILPLGLSELRPGPVVHPPGDPLT
jgi:PAS domain S-box-containing protein